MNNNETDIRDVNTLLPPAGIPSAHDATQISPSSIGDQTVVGRKDTVEDAPKYTDYEWPEDNSGWFVGVIHFSGRWRRREFSLVFAIILIISSFFNSWITIPVFTLASVKRLKDIGWSPYLGWLSFFVYSVLYVSILISSVNPEMSHNMIYVTVSFLVFIFWGILLCLYPGEKGINKYGSNPRRNYEEQCEEIGLPKLSDCKY